MSTEAEEYRPSRVRKPGDKEQLCARQCATCVGRPGNLMGLRPGRLQALIRDNTGQGTMGLICHETLRYGQHPEQGEALCRWFYERFGHLVNGIRVMERLGGFDEIELPGMEDSDG
jgi:hypothetical protein